MRSARRVAGDDTLRALLHIDTPLGALDRFGAQSPLDSVGNAFMRSACPVSAQSSLDSVGNAFMRSTRRVAGDHALRTLSVIDTPLGALDWFLLNLR